MIGKPQETVPMAQEERGILAPAIATGPAPSWPSGRRSIARNRARPALSVRPKPPLTPEGVVKMVKRKTAKRRSTVDHALCTGQVVAIRGDTRMEVAALERRDRPCVTKGQQGSKSRRPEVLPSVSGPMG